MRKIALALVLLVGALALAQAQIVLPGGNTNGAVPGGSAGGDLGGTYPSPTVTNGSHITNSSIPNSGLATPAPCSAFGTTTGTCLQGGAGNVPNNSLVTPPTAVGTATVGQIPGTTTNDSASAGNVGEYVVSGASSFAKVGTIDSSVTVSIGSNAVVTWTGNPYFNSLATGNGCASLVVFGGTPPTGITATTVPYYVTCDGSFTANAFHISDTVAHAIAGTNTITTSGSDGGTTASNVFGATTFTFYDYGGLSLTAGDWDVTSVVRYGVGSTTSITELKHVISSATGGGGTPYSLYQWFTAAEVPANPLQIPSSVERVTLNATTTLFCSALTQFSISTMTVGGSCRARRVR